MCALVLFPGVGDGKVISTLNGVLTPLFIPVAHRGGTAIVESVAVPDQDGTGWKHLVLLSFSLIVILSFYCRPFNELTV